MSSTSYMDLIAIVKEVAQLRLRLAANPSETDIKHYKLVIKTFEAYTRLKEHPEILLDTINSVSLPPQNQNQNQNQNQTQNPPPYATLPPPPNQSNVRTYPETKQDDEVKTVDGGIKNPVLYLFGNNGNGQENGPIDNSEIDSDMEPDELFLDDSTQEELPDDKDVELMLKKSTLQLKRALNNKSYVVTPEPSDDVEEDEKSETPGKPEEQPPAPMNSEPSVMAKPAEQTDQVSSVPTVQPAQVSSETVTPGQNQESGKTGRFKLISMDDEEFYECYDDGGYKTYSDYAARKMAMSGGIDGDGYRADDEDGMTHGRIDIR